MDVKNINYDAGRFDVVLDKATIDCFFVAYSNLVRKRFN